VDLVGNDNLKDGLRADSFARLPDPPELGESCALPQIGMTDEKTGLQRTQGVNRRRRCFDLVMGRRDAEFRHLKRKVMTQFDHDGAATLAPPAPPPVN